MQGQTKRKEPSQDSGLEQRRRQEHHTGYDHSGRDDNQDTTDQMYGGFPITSRAPAAGPSGTRIELQLHTTYVPTVTTTDTTQHEPDEVMEPHVRTEAIRSLQPITNLEDALRADMRNIGLNVRSIDMFRQGDSAPIPWTMYTTPASLHLANNQQIQVNVYYTPSTGGM